MLYAVAVNLKALQDQRNWSQKRKRILMMKARTLVHRILENPAKSKWPHLTKPSPKSGILA